jgi:hypothetical protein
VTRPGGPYLLAIAAGTGGCRALQFAAAGEQAAVSQQEWVHRAPPGVAGGQDFDVHANWQAIAACVRAALRAAGAGGADVAAVSTTRMREGIVLYDAVGTDIWACPNVDSRPSVEAAELIGHFDIICGLTAWRRDRGKERQADRDTVIDAERFLLDVSARSKPYDLKGSGALDWGMQSRLARIFRPPANRTVMLAIDHGYFQGPTNGLERVDLSIVPLLKYADALMATRGIVRTTIPAASPTPVVLRASGGPGTSCVSCPTSRSRSAWRTRPGSTARWRPCRCSSAGSSSHARCTT